MRALFPAGDRLEYVIPKTAAELRKDKVGLQELVVSLAASNARLEERVALLEGNVTSLWQHTSRKDVRYDVSTPVQTDTQPFAVVTPPKPVQPIVTPSGPFRGSRRFDNGATSFPAGMSARRHLRGKSLDPGRAPLRERS